ncbi:MAG: N-acetylglucosamine-6-phosphate deacetylase [Clostridiales bacterium]|nr:N-acetylglucosamine-6-phosphate deacetylase [Clostridiales bacterium]
MLIKNAKVYNAISNTFEKRDVCTDKGIISSSSKDGIVIDAIGKYLVPGLVDGHTHGRMGIDILKADKKQLEELSLRYLESGVTTVFPTVMTAPMEDILKAIDNIKSAETKGAEFAGIHVEGPYISPNKPGCHNVSLIRKPVADEMIEIAKRIYPLKAKFTIAPEEAEEGTIEKLSEYAKISIGHTNATSRQAYDALLEGANSFTHTFNAMSPITHRNPGAASAALSSEAYSEFICDGIHVDYDVIEMAYKAKTRWINKFVLITDSIPQAGLPYGKYEMNGIPFTLSTRGAREEDGTLVGSTLSMLQAMQNVVKNCGVPLEDAVASASTVPCLMLGLLDRGKIIEGKIADLLILDDKLNIEHIIRKGEVFK